MQINAPELNAQKTFMVLVETRLLLSNLETMLLFMSRVSGDRECDQSVFEAVTYVASTAIKCHNDLNDEYLEKLSGHLQTAANQKGGH